VTELLQPLEESRPASFREPDRVEKAPSKAAQSRSPQWLLPLSIVSGAVLVAGVLMLTRPAVETRRPEILPPLIRVVEAQPKALRLDVSAEGTVQPSTESDLVAEVAGRVVEVSPSLVEGGFFETGAVLLRLDDRDYQVALEKASAQVDRAASEAALAERALERRRALAEEGVASASDLDEFENRARVARAALRDARADRERARLDLERTVVAAPYAGRVLEARVDVGQFVARGTALAALYAVDWAEVRLPVPDEALAYLAIPLDFRRNEHDPPEVELSARVGGREARWTGFIHRVEGQIDPRSRMVTLVARVADPYGRAVETAGVPLAVGLFVEARIAGRQAEAVYELPSVALRASGQVLVVDGDERLHFREVDVLRRGDETVLIRAGLAPGERVSVSPLEAVTDGMQVRTTSRGG